MNCRRIPWLVALAGVLGPSSLYWLASWSRTSQAAPAPSSDAAFKGKVLLVSTNDMMTVPCLLEKAQVLKLGEHSFLVGEGAMDGDMGDWYKGRIIRLPMEHIVSITEFDDLKEAKKAFGGGRGGFGAPVVPRPGVSCAPADLPPSPAAGLPSAPVLPPAKE